MRRPTPFAERAAGLTECGRRRVNQDAVLVAELDGGGELVAVADGMGGHAAGEIASRRTLEVLRREVERGATLADAVRAANAAVHEEARGDPEKRGMGTTLVALLRHGSTWSLASVGDSRGYLVENGAIRQLTRDHSFAAEAAYSGRLSAEEAGRSPWRNAVTRAIGTDATVEVDTHGPFAVRPGASVLLCSDGLYRVLSDGALHQAVTQDEAPAAIVRRLIDAALSAGSDDNVSAAIVRFEAEPAPDRQERPRPVRPASGERRREPRRRRPRRQTEGAARWPLLEAGLILLGVVVVVVYALVLGLVT
jgi:PPM family protein phosphatase